MTDVPHVPPHSSSGGHVFHPEGFGRKLGPFPIWGWAILLAAAVYIWFRFFNGGGGSTASGAPASGLDNTDLSALGINSASPGIGSGSGTSPTAASFLDNSAWQNAAIGEASQFGGTPLDVEQATDTYLNGGTLNQTQAGIINKILGALGAAPLGTLGTPSVQPPASTATAKPTLTLGPGQAIVTSSTQAAKNLIDLNTGRVTHIYSKEEWNSLRAKYGNNIPITTLNASAIAKAGGHN